MISSEVIPGAITHQLACGSLRFTAYEMGEGPLVLCVHGFPDTAYTWRHMLPALAEAGFRAVAVTLRGYEPSSQPGASPTPDQYRVFDLAQDIADWIDALGATSAHLVTHDWGASIAYAAARKNPDRIRSMVTMAVPHPARFGALVQSNKAQKKASSYIVFFQLKGIAEAWVQRDNFSFFDRTWAKWSPDWDGASNDLTQLKTAFREPGVLKAALSYYRAATNTKDSESLGLFAGSIPVPTLGLTGANDGCILNDVFLEAMQVEDFPAGLDVQTVEAAGHFLHLEKPDEVNARVIAFLHSQA